MVDGAFLVGFGHEGLLAVGLHGLMVVEGSVEILLVFDGFGPLAVGIGRVGHVQDILREFLPGGGVGIRGGEIVAKGSQTVYLWGRGWLYRGATKSSPKMREGLLVVGCRCHDVVGGESRPRNCVFGSASTVAEFTA